MVRWLFLLLPLCLMLQDRPITCAEPLGGGDAEAVQVCPKEVVFEHEELLRGELVASLALATPQPFPGSIPWAPMHEIGTKGLYPVDFLMHYHPPLFLEMCLERYKREVRGYSTKFIKRERIGGKLEPLEKLEVHCREQPFSVYMNWLEGAKLAQKVLYVEGENNGKLLARGKGLLAGLGVFAKDVDSAEAKKTGRYTIDQFGPYLGTKRTVAAMHNAEMRGALHVAYQGLYKVPELGDRICHKFVRSPYQPLEEEGVNELTIYIDQENWMQVGSVLRDVHGNLIAEYFFRDLKINPEFKQDQFTRAAL
jgi:hypothetical protein